MTVTDIVKLSIALARCPEVFGPVWAVDGHRNEQGRQHRISGQLQAEVKALLDSDRDEAQDGSQPQPECRRVGHCLLDEPAQRYAQDDQQRERYGQAKRETTLGQKLNVV